MSRLVLILFACGALAAQDTADTHLGLGYDALKQERFDEAVTEFRAALAIDPTLQARARFPLAVALFQSMKLTDSRREFEAVRRTLGDQPNTFYYLGRIDLQEKNYESAAAKLTKAMAEPPFPDTAYYLGVAFFKQGKFALAEKWLKAAPPDSAALYQLAQVYRAEGREPDARKMFAQSQKARQQSAEENQLKVECGQKLDRATREEAHATCNKLYDPNNAEKLAALGTIYGQHGDLEAAVEPLRRAAELSPQSPQMQYNLAFTYYQLNRFEEARVPIARAAERWPDIFQVSFLYGLILLKQQNEHDAWPVLQRAHQLNPRDEAAIDLLYRTAMVLGRNSLVRSESGEAVRYFEEATKLRPDNPDARDGLAEAIKRSKIGDQ